MNINCKIGLWILQIVVWHIDYWIMVALNLFDCKCLVHYLSYQCYLYFKISINNSDKGNKYFILFHFKGKLRKKYWPTFDFKLMWLWNRIHVNLKDWWREITIMSASINLSNRFLLQLLLQLIWKCLLNENFNPLNRTNLWFCEVTNNSFILCNFFFLA